MATFGVQNYNLIFKTTTTTFLSKIEKNSVCDIFPFETGFNQGRKMREREKKIELRLSNNTFEFFFTLESNLFNFETSKREGIMGYCCLKDPLVSNREVVLK